MLAVTMRRDRLSLIGMRMLWIVLATMISLYLIAGSPHLIIYYELPCEASPHPLPICPATEKGLWTLGLDRIFLAWYHTLWIVAICVPAFILYSLLAWRKRDDSKTLLFSIAMLLGLVININFNLPDVFVESYPAARLMVFTLAYLGQISLMVFYVFPDGRFVPRWTRWTAIVLAVLSLVSKVLYWWSLPFVAWPSETINFFLWVVFPLTLSYALLCRYRRTVSREQRQQLKWVVWAVASASAFFAADATIDFAGSWFGWNTTMPIWYSIHQVLVSPTIDYVGILLSSFCFYVAVFRFRLWNIDFFINRSLVYGGLTILLGSILVGVFTATQALLGIMVKNMQAGAAGTVSLIVAIALFAPVRDRLQRFVDSRVYGVDPNHERMVQAAIAQERDRLSRELHDSVTQSLYGLTIMAESCQRLVRDDDAREPLIEMGDVARQALKEMRLLIHELRPPILEEEGLLSALHQRLAVVERRSGIEANLAIEEVVDLPVVMEEAFYHIAIEALNNAIKHAAATSVSLSLRTGDAWVELKIADNGKGFDLDSDSGKGGMGLAGMRKRAEELGGTLTVYSVPGQGTKITAKIAYHTDARRREPKAV